MALRRSIAKAIRAMSPSNTACAARDLGSTVEEAIAKVTKQVKLPAGYHIDWAGEYESQKRSHKRLAIVVPITLLVICMILYTMFKSVKWVLLILANVAMAPIGGLLALAAHGHALQRFFGRWISGAIRRLGADRRHHAGVHQPAARARPNRSWMPPSTARSSGFARS